MLNSIDDGTSSTIIVTDTTTTINDLHPHYTYTCNVLAFTVGSGPTANITFQMPSDSK